MNRKQAFEQHWATVHDVPVESMEQYRWLEKDGYRLPDMASAYRNFCAGWDARAIQAEEDLEDLRLQAFDDACRAES